MRSPLLCLVLIFLGWLLSSQIAIADPAITALARARTLPLGTEVALEGIVTVPSGQFASANLDQGFAIQDPSGGIYIRSDRNLGLQMGETVTVGGTVQDDDHGQRILRLGQWQRRDRPRSVIAPPIVPIKTASTQLDGQLVKVQGTIVRPLVEDAPYGDRLWIEDPTGIVQIYIPKSTAINPARLRFLQPGKSIQVTGLSSQYDGNDEVIPRTLADIALIGA
jgi:uncharacterized protein YdeI (BOF family)